MMKPILACGVMLTISSAAFAAEFGTFAQETKEVSFLLGCKGKITTTPELPDLWSCISPGAEVVKLFINENSSGGIQNVKLMWNDWTRDTGYGIHTDNKIAEEWATLITKRYIPKKADNILKAFTGDQNVTVAENGYEVSYTYFRGPAIDERLLTISSK